MDARDAIKANIGTADMVCHTYLDDLNDEEMMHRPHAGCNHLKWQVGHLVAADHMMVEGICPGTMPPLPAGFAERYSKETIGNDDPQAFDSKADLLRLATAQREAALAALAKIADADLDCESPESFRAYAPTVGAVFSMLGSHWMMHAGQWVIVRRQLGKEVKI